MTSISFIKTPKGLTFVAKGKHKTIPSSHPMFASIEEELKKGKNANIDEILALTELDKIVQGLTFGKVTITSDKVYYNNRPVGTALTKRILEMLDQGYDIEPWGLFMDNVMLNPSKVAQEELHLFLESGNMPITPDGHFLAFKKVNANLTSIHDGKTQHVLGEALSMPREKVDSDRNSTCSRGLHFCAQSYLSQYQHNTDCVTLVLKINPADVVAIPSDYNNTKGRAWKYVPIAILTEDGEELTDTYKKPVVGSVKGVDTFETKQKTKKGVIAKFFDLSPAKFLKEVKKLGGARPFAREHSLAKSTVQDWVRKAKELVE